MIKSILQLWRKSGPPSADLFRHNGKIGGRYAPAMGLDVRTITDDEVPAFCAAMNTGFLNPTGDIDADARRPGMILDAARRLGLDLDHSVAVGDRWRDVDAAHRAGVASVWIDWGLGEPLQDSPGARFGSLAQARDHVLKVCGADGARPGHGT